MKFAKGGVFEQGIVITGDADSLVPVESINVDNLRTALKLDLLLLELEESLENEQSITISF